MLPVRVFEAFAGYGSQRMALRNMHIPFDVVGISEIEGDVLLSYAAIHTDFLELRKEYQYPSESSMKEFLQPTPC